jgi:RNA polymerase sigma-70 factor (ECF subfamily)
VTSGSANASDGNGSDRALVEAARGGDRDALDRLLRRHYDRLHALCWRMTGGGADADDAAQEALMAIVRGLDRFDARARFTTWAYRVTVNACLDELRRRGRRPRPVADAELDRPATGPGPESAVDRVAIDGALQELAPDFRAAVVLRDLCGLDYTEIADVLGIPPGTVRSRIARGRADLARRLEGNPEAPTDRPSRQP